VCPPPRKCGDSSAHPHIFEIRCHIFELHDFNGDAEACAQHLGSVDVREGPLSCEGGEGWAPRTKVRWSVSWRTDLGFVHFICISRGGELGILRKSKVG
jgi:hypothetical protein